MASCLDVSTFGLLLSCHYIIRTNRVDVEISQVKSLVESYDRVV
jgi:hypothetical protein